MAAIGFGVLMPKASMHEYYLQPAGKRQVRLSGKVLSVKPIAVAKPVRDPTHFNFRLGVAAFDLPHVGRAPFGGYRIH